MLLLGWMMILHFIADFLFQSREMGQKKSSEFRWLFKHLTIQWLFFAFGLVYFVGPVVAISFATLNCIAHGVIDWYIWRGYKLFTHNRLVKESHQAAYMNGNLNIPYEVRQKEKYDEKLASFKYWEDHWFYSTIGLDQLLHGLTIVALFAILV